MTSKYTDDQLKGPETQGDVVAHFKNLVDKAASLELCLGCKKCDTFLDLIRDISIQAREDLVKADPNDTIKIMQIQQTAKVFDAFVMAAKRVLMDGQAAETELSRLEVDNG